MQCRHCGQNVPAGRFCLSCGQAMVAPAAPLTAPGASLGARPVVSPPAQRRRPVAALIACLALLAMLLGGGTIALLRGNNVAASGRPDSRTPAGSVVVAPQADVKPGPPVAVSPQGLNSAPNPVNVTQPPPQAAGMPDDINAYLERLHRIERMRLATDADYLEGFEQEALTAFYELMLKASSDLEGAQEDASQLTRIFERVTAAYQRIRAEFDRTVPPVPQPCATLHRSYAEMLDTMAAVVRQVARQPLTGSTTSAKRVGRSGQGAFIQAVDEANGNLKDLCARYNQPPRFKIEIVSTGSQSGLGGLLGGP